MAIKHIVLMKFRDSITPTEIEHLKSSLAHLVTLIPQVLHFSWAINNSPEALNQGYVYGFEMIFQNDADRTLYLEHPEHVLLAHNIILPALQDGKNSLLVFDYMCDVT